MQGEIVLPIKQHRDEVLITIIILVAALIFLGLPTVALAALCTKYLQSYRTRKEYLVFGAISLLGFGVGTFHFSTIISSIGGEIISFSSFIAATFVPQRQQTFNGEPFITLAFNTLPLSPILGGAMDFFKRLEEALRTGDSIDDKLARAQKLEEERKLRLQNDARQKAAKGPQGTHPRELEIGTLMRGDSLPMTDKEYIGVKQRGEWIVLDDEILDEHHFVLGRTGAGKTTALLRIVEEVLKDEHNKRRLLVVDGKGEEKLAQAIRALVWKYRKHDTPIFRLGGHKQGARFDGFTGTDEAICNRLAEMVGVSEAEGNAIWFADLNRNVLQHICYAPGGAPKSFTDLGERLSLGWLHGAYQKDQEILDQLEELPDDAVLKLAARLRPWIRELKDRVGEGGFSLKDTDTAVFSIKALSVSDTAKRFCYFLIATMNDMVSNLEESNDSGLLLIDEFGVFGVRNISALLSQARSSRWGVGLYTQTYAQLGDDLMAEEILTNTTTKFLMGTDYPDKLGTSAGTKYQVESSIQSNELGPTGMMSGRIQHAFKVDPNTVRRFQRGQSFLIRSGYALALQVSKVELTGEELAAMPPEPVGTPVPPSVPVPEEVTGTTSEAAQTPENSTEQATKKDSKRKKNTRGRGSSTL